MFRSQKSAICGSLFGLLVGCGIALPDPEPQNVSPEWGYNGENTTIVIEGKAFYPQVEVDAGSSGAGDVDRGFVVYLGDNPLTAVTLLDYGTLEAIVPEGLEAGSYDVVVEGPTGATGNLESGFTVTSTRADALDIDAEDLVYEVYDTAWLAVQLLDPEGAPLLEDLEVRVTVQTSNGENGEFSDDSLVNQTSVGGTEGFAITGSLGDDGFQQIGVTMFEPARVDIVVEAFDGDSTVAEGVFPAQWEAGSSLVLDVALPDDDYTARAGEAFEIVLTVLDQYDNVVDGVTQSVVLSNQCGGFDASLFVQGTETLDVELYTATSESCEEDRIYAVDGPEGSSEVFAVEPGDAAAFLVSVNEGPSTAGEKELAVFVTPLDDYGNTADWSAAPLTLVDSVGGLDTTTGVGTASCVGSSLVYCAASGEVAADGITLTVSDPTGITGTSNTYIIEPGDPAELMVELAEAPVTAGEAFELTVRVLDGYGNQIDVSTLGSASLLLTDGLSESSCAGSSVDEDGGAVFECTLFTASDNTFTAQLASWDLQGTSDVFEVVNGELVELELVTSQSTVTAGVAFEVKVYGYDTWGNAYLEQSDPSFDLEDSTGTWSVSSATLGANGTTTPLGSITVSGDTELVASQYGVELGRSDVITVEPGSMTALEVDVDVAWVFAGDSATVSLTALDSYGNTADYDGTAEVSSSSGAGEDVNVNLSAGEGASTFTWEEVALPDALDALTDEGVSASSDGIYVLTSCSSSGPEAALAFSGYAEGVACLSASTGIATVSSSLADSQDGTFPIAWYGLSLGSAAEVDTGDTFTTTLGRAGIFRATGMVADTVGCAEEVQGWVYVGDDDGEPVGPITVEIDDTGLSAGQSSAVTTVRVSDVGDCTRDVSTGTVLVRTDLGEITGATASGAGLELNLDSSGSASASLDLSAGEHDGTSTVWVGAASGAALGTGTLTVVDESANPFLLEQDPTGDVSGELDTVTLAFSEPLLSGSVTTSAFTVETPDGDLVEPDTVAIAPSGSTLTLSFDDALDADDGVHQLEVSTDIRDESGNRLDGQWSGSSGSYTGWFGASTLAADPVDSCKGDLVAFRPDGDDGSDVESDEVQLTLESDSAPERWVVEVVDDSATLVLHDRPVATGATDTWSWDGRGNDGIIVENGVYTIEVDAEDGQGNRAGSCSYEVTVDNLMENLDE